jgi:hypothetical protein
VRVNAIDRIDRLEVGEHCCNAFVGFAHGYLVEGIGFEIVAYRRPAALNSCGADSLSSQVYVSLF